MYKVAVIGLGYFSQFHLKSWGTMPGAHLVAATDLDPARRAWAQAEMNAPIVADLQEALAQDPDIVDIVAPPVAHAELVQAALAKGRTIICQKPFCTSLDEARAVTDTAEKAGARLLIHENFRFQPWYRTMKNVLDSGTLGQVFSARFALRPGDGRGPDAYLSRQPSFQTMKRLLIHETGVHFIDLFRWLLGDVRAVYADLRQLNPVLQGEDAGLMILHHDSGATSTFDGNRLSDHRTDAPRRTMGEMEIEGEGGTLCLDGMGRVTLRAFGTQNVQHLEPAYPPDETFGGGCVNALNMHVVAALDGRQVFENEAKDYLPVIALSELAYTSDARGQKMKVEKNKMFAVCVELTIRPGQMDKFLPLMRANASTSLREEPDCHRFDVVQVDDAPDLITLYEVYTNAAAFQTHLGTTHFQQFDAAVTDLVAQKSVRTGTVL
ncbi:MAG: Gfo/Idh/MocA family oxidoreductase [Paracoccaceae bacterium]